MNPKSKEFKKLQDSWYKKLKRSGFKDIEYDESKFNRSLPGQDNRTDVNWLYSKAEYYRAAEHFLTNHNFETKSDRIIWANHSEGMSIRQIVTVLRKRKIKANKNSVNHTINSLQEIMLREFNGKERPHSD